MHGLYRSLISNMVVGVSEGYERVMEVVGVGYKAEASGNMLELSSGILSPDRDGIASRNLGRD